MSDPALILASKSASRRAMLDAAGVTYICIPAEIDERAVESELGSSSPAQVAEGLSLAKAYAVASFHPETLVLGSDSLVVCGGRRFDKPATLAEAEQHLRFFSGKELQLHSGAALVRGSDALWSHSSIARMQVRALSDAFIAHYLDQEWPAISHTVGCFRIEGMGVQLFDRIEGDQFTILGMPLLPLLGALRDHGVLTA